MDGCCFSKMADRSTTPTENITQHEQEATAPPPKTLQNEFYNLHYDPKKIAIIFNHENFDEEAKRDGTNLDAERIKVCLESFGFNTEVHQDKIKDEVMEAIKDVSKKSSKEVCCIIIVVLTHVRYIQNPTNEKRESVLCAKDSTYKMMEIIDPLISKTNQADGVDVEPVLVGVPKLFFFLGGPPIVEQPHDGDDGEDVKTVLDKTALHANLLIMFSSFDGKVNVSWFIKKICEQLNERYKEFDLMQILTIVNREMAKKLSDLRITNKQVPVIKSTLTKLLKFEKFIKT